MPDKGKTIELHKGEGDALWFLGGLYEVKATGKQTGGSLSVLEITIPANSMGSPPHIHDDNEAAYILDGTVTYHIGDKKVDAAAGSFFFFPKGQMEWFENTSSKPARMLIMYTPGGFEEFFLESAEPAKARTLPPPMQGPPDMEKLTAAAKKHGTTLLPPK